MSIEFTMPSLGADMDSGTLVAWRVQVGDTLRRGDIIAVVETPKAEVEVEVWQDGVVVELLVTPGTKVPVGAVLALLSPLEEATDLAPAPVPRASSPRLRVSPAARRRAAELGIDLATVVGSGPGGAITLADLSSEPAAPSAPTGVDAMRSAIAAAMSRSKREIPHYYLIHEVDLSAAMEWIEAHNQRSGASERLVPTALLLAATARALVEQPALNGFWRQGRFEPAEGVHPGVAIALRGGGGLVAPALLDADKLSLRDLMRAFRDLVARTRAGNLRGAELTRATITVTSLGERGVDGVFGVIYPPQVALVGFGAVVTRPRMVDGVVVPRHVLTATLCGDHRASDGLTGARLLRSIASLLQEPDAL